MNIKHLIAIRNALESWEDAFRDEHPEDAAIIRECLVELNRTIEEMEGPLKPILRLVPPKDEIN